MCIIYVYESLPLYIRFNLSIIYKLQRNRPSLLFLVNAFEASWRSNRLPCDNGARHFFTEVDGDKSGHIDDNEITYFFHLFDANGKSFFPLNNGVAKCTRVTNVSNAKVNLLRTLSKFVAEYFRCSLAGVTERSDSRRILTPGSFFYVEM
jgi:hypothetical protein